MSQCLLGNCNTPIPPLPSPGVEVSPPDWVVTLGWLAVLAFVVGFLFYALGAARVLRDWLRRRLSD